MHRIDLPAPTRRSPDPAGCGRGLSFAAALALALVPGLAGTTRADEVLTRVQATVTAISGAPSVKSALAEHGVSLGADVLVEFVVDSAAPLGTSVNPAYKLYTPAVVAARVSIGSYEAAFDDEHGLPILNMVQVGDDVFTPPIYYLDSYLLAASGSDTASILQGTGVGALVGCVFNFGDGDGTSLSGSGVVQDVGGFDGPANIGIGNVTGPNGNISFSFDLGSTEFDAPGGIGGGGGGGGGSDFALASKGQLLAAARFARRVLMTDARFAQAPPTVDPQGSQQAEQLDKAAEAFGTQFVNAVNKALKKGGSAPLPADAKDQVVSDLSADLQGHAELLMSGSDERDPQDRALRGKLLRAAARLVAADLAAHGKNAIKPSRSTLLGRLSAARGKFVQQAGKALDKGDAQGLIYAGPPVEQYADMVEALAEAFAGLTAGG